MSIKHCDNYKKDSPASNTVFNCPIDSNNPLQYISATYKNMQYTPHPHTHTHTKLGW